MQSFAALVQQGAAQAWLFVPSAILLGALHGLEPGHSKTMMAAFIVAVRGTVAQAALLGLSAALSHTAIVWLVALGGQYLGRNAAPEAIEPYLQLAAGLIVAGVAAWMILRTWRDRQAACAWNAHAHHHHGHDHGHHHHHAHGPEIGEDGEYMDAHARAHAADIAHRFHGRQVTTGQIVMFGLTGGLIPCPAAITVLLMCLQLRELTLGVVLVACFSLGLAVTLVSVGVIAALGAGHARQRWPALSALAGRAPYASGALMLLVALYMVASGTAGLAGGHG